MPLRLGWPAMRATRGAAAGCPARGEGAGVWPEIGEKAMAATSAVAAAIAPLNRVGISQVSFSMLPPVLLLVFGTHIVRRVLIEADELNQLRIDPQPVGDPRGERLRVGFRIVDRHLDLESAVCGTSITFDELAGARQRA